MSVPPEAVEAAMKALGCEPGPHKHFTRWVKYGGNAREMLYEPTDLGCPVAVAVAAAVIEVQKIKKEGD